MTWTGRLVRIRAMNHNAAEFVLIAGALNGISMAKI
jgi:hypothetical protein